MREWGECAGKDLIDTPILLTAIQEEALWEQAIRVSFRNEDDSRDALLNIPETAAAARRARDLLLSWEAPQDPRAFEGSSDTQAFFEWMTTIERRLRESGWITFGELPRALWTKAREERSSSKTIELAGFDEIVPADRKLFDALGIPQNTGNLPGRSGQSIDGAPAAGQLNLPFANLRRARCADRVDELVQAAGWARRVLEQRPAARIGVVVRGLAELSSTAERIFDDTLHPGCGFAVPDSMRAFHVSAGGPSSEAPLIDAALLLLGLGGGLRVSEAGRLLRSPFSHLDDAGRIAADRELRKREIESVSFDSPAIRNLFVDAAAYRHGLPERMRPSQWSAAFSRLLKASGWPGPRALSSAEYQTVEHWKDLLSSLAQLDLVMPPLGYSQAFARLSRIAAGSRFAPSDAPGRSEEAPVQVMDMLEAAGSRFDALWVAGLHAGAWPQPSRPDPFLPRELQRAAGMPRSSPERELAYAQRVTARLIESAPEIVFSHPARDVEEALLPSPLIESIPEDSGLPGPRETALRRVFGPGVALEERVDDRVGALAPDTMQHGGMKVIADQSACPFRAFAIHRLQAREMEEPPLGVTPRDHGNVTHDALRFLWRELGSQDELMARTPGQLVDLVRACVAEALEKSFGVAATPAAERFRVLEQARLERLLAQWLDGEKKRPRFTVVQSELDEEASIGGLRFTIRADRVDQYAGGSHAIVDYKTAKLVSASDWEGDRPDAPQLPLYAVTSTRQVSEIAFAQLTAAKLAWINETNVRREIGDWKRILEKIALDFREGHAEVDPKDRRSTCRLCKLPSLCRIGDVAANAEEEDAEDGADE